MSRVVDFVIFPKKKTNTNIRNDKESLYQCSIKNPNINAKNGQEPQ